MKNWSMEHDILYIDTILYELQQTKYNILLHIIQIHSEGRKF
jgi:hypothetical protein